MVSFRSAILAAAFVVGAVSLGETIDPSSVDDDTKERWCNDQRNTCPFICDQVEPRTTEQNDCFEENLTYVCICGDGKPANVTKYTLTLPYYICQEYGNQCVKKCGEGNNACASKCREEHPCGATAPDRVNATTTSAMSKPTQSDDSDDGTKIYDSPGSSNKDEGGSGAAALNAAGAYGLAVVIGGLFAGAAML